MSRPLRIEYEAERTVDGATATWGYPYDDAGRLTEVSADGTSVHLYAYDPNGNRTRHIGPSGTTAAEYDARDRLVRYGETRYAYNKAGDLTQKTGSARTTQYHYDALGNLRGVEQPDGTTIDYIIDGRNRRVGKKVNGTLEKGWGVKGSRKGVSVKGSSLYRTGLRCQRKGVKSIPHRLAM